MNLGSGDRPASGCFDLTGCKFLTEGMNPTLQPDAIHFSALT